MTAGRPPTVRWEIPRALPGPGLHVWRIDLDAHDAADPSVLAADELARAGRFADPSRRQRFVALRTAARCILGRYADATPAALEFGAEQRGKPHLAYPPTRWAFNLTDSGALALLAVSDRSPVGVDLEVLRPVSRWQRIARRILADADCRAVEAADERDREALFLAHWTAHEARQKATGEGLHGIRADATQWQVLHFSPRPSWIAAVAFAAGVDLALQWLEYRP